MICWLVCYKMACEESGSLVFWMIICCFFCRSRGDLPVIDGVKT